MTNLGFAAAYWLALHMLVAGPLRPVLIDHIGQHRFRAFFSIASVIGLIWLILAYRMAPYVPLWQPPHGVRHLAMVLVLLAFILLVLGAGPSNPTLAGADLLLKDRLPVSGVVRITRHPMLWAFTLWATAHLLANGHLAAVLLFGSILVTALNGMISIDRKRRADLGTAWDRFTAQTSRIPFAAIVGGRTQLRVGELPLWRIGLGGLLFAAALLAHGKVFGVSPLS
jgi:uncharacterized membrane protein